MNLLYIYLFFSISAFFVTSKFKKPDINEATLDIVFNKITLFFILSYSVVVSYFITDNLMGMLVTAIALIGYYILLGISYSTYSTTHFNWFYMFSIVFLSTVLIISMRYILIESSTFLLMLFFYIFPVYGTYFFKTNNSKMKYVLVALAFSLTILFSINHYIPDFMDAPQVRTSKAFLITEYNAEPTFIYYDKNLRGEAMEVKAFFTSEDFEIPFQVDMIYQDGQIIKYEKINR